jgi:hypothetical protein
MSRRQVGVAVARQIAPTLIVGQDHDDVRTLLSLKQICRLCNLTGLTSFIFYNIADNRSAVFSKNSGLETIPSGKPPGHYHYAALKGDL